MVHPSPAFSLKWVNGPAALQGVGGVPSSEHHWFRRTTCRKIRVFFLSTNDDSIESRPARISSSRKISQFESHPCQFITSIPFLLFLFRGFVYSFDRSLLKSLVFFVLFQNEPSKRFISGIGALSGSYTSDGNFGNCLVLVFLLFL